MSSQRSRAELSQGYNESAKACQARMVAGSGGEGVSFVGKESVGSVVCSVSIGSTESSESESESDEDEELLDDGAGAVCTGREMPS